MSAVIANHVEDFIRRAYTTFVWTSPYYQQADGKLEHSYQPVKVIIIHPQSPGSLTGAWWMDATFGTGYNSQRLHSAIGYVALAVKFAGREQEVWAAQDRELRADRRQGHHLQRVASRAAAFHCSEATTSHSH